MSEAGLRPSREQASGRLCRRCDGLSDHLSQGRQTMSADEEKTRILQRRSAAAPRPDAAADGGEKIVFHCPNGHRIVASAALAGKRGKCSKCQVDVVIPLPGGAEAAAAASPEPASPPPPPLVGPPVEPEPAAGSGESLPQLTVGPPPAPPVAAADDVQVGPPEPAGESEERENWSFIGGEVEASAPEVFEAPAWDSGNGGGAFPAEAGNPTAVLVARLWAEREHGGIIELHLEGGSVILPDWYDAAWSRGTHGLFASQAADGSVTLTAVAWETVRKVVVRQLTEVPDDMFT